MHSINAGAFSGEHSINLIMTLFRAEKHAAVTYSDLLKTIHTAPFPAELVNAMHCHQSRADLLAGEIRRSGAQPLMVVPESIDDISDWTEERALEALDELEISVSKKYMHLLASHDFSAQLLARRLYPQQEISAASIKNMIESSKERAA